jgi:type IV secretion system protein VirB9
MRAGLSVALLAMATSSAWALPGAEEGGYDRRIRYVRYDAEEVVQLELAVGVAAHIVLEPGEKYVTHAFGDAKAWEFRAKEHHVFLKAVAPQAEGNLTIVTDRRSYHFALKLGAGNASAGVYELIFDFPDSRGRKADQEEVERAWSGPPKKVNVAYSMSGDEDLAPVNAWDNGEFTYFKFPGNRDIPAIYMVDADGAESIVNRHSTGGASDVVVVHKVAPQWVLRLGSRVLGIWNDAYDSFGRWNATRTASQGVKRVLWKEGGP